MDHIIADLKDPAWWFSAFVVAIIASVVAGFTKDFIGRGIAAFSQHYRVRLNLYKTEHGAVVETLAQNEGFLIITFVRSTLSMLMFFSTSTMLVLIKMWSQIEVASCQGATPVSDCTTVHSPLHIIVFVMFGLLSIQTGYRSAVMIRTTMQGYSAYRKLRKFPAIK